MTKNILFLTLLLFSFNTIEAQNKLIRFFDQHEIIQIVNDEIHMSKVYSRNCKMTYDYKDKSFKFACKAEWNSQMVYQIFNYVETKNNVKYVSLFGNGSNPVSVYKVNDMLFEKNIIEFVQNFVLPSGERGQEIYRYRNVL